MTLLLAEDRGLSVPPGATVSAAYVPIHRIRLACRDRMAVGDVERAYRRRLQIAKAARVAVDAATRQAPREKALGYWQQPLPANPAPPPTIPEVR